MRLCEWRGDGGWRGWGEGVLMIMMGMMRVIVVDWGLLGAWLRGEGLVGALLAGGCREGPGGGDLGVAFAGFAIVAPARVVEDCGWRARDDCNVVGGWGAGGIAGVGAGLRELGVDVVGIVAVCGGVGEGVGVRVSV